MTFAELRDEVPLLDGVIAYGEGKTWAGQMAIGANVLTVLSAAGAIVRATNAGAWTTSRPRWAAMSAWLGAPIEPRTEADGTAGARRGVAARLRPGDGRRHRVVARLDADGGPPRAGRGKGGGRRSRRTRRLRDARRSGRRRRRSPPWIALLPPLDPTTMGWKERDWYLGPHKQRRVRHERQRRRDDLVRRPHRRRVAPGRVRRGRGAAARGRRPRGTPGHRRRSRASHGLAGRRAGRSRASRRRCAADPARGRAAQTP